MTDHFFRRTLALLLALMMLSGAVCAEETVAEPAVRRICFVDDTADGYLDDGDANLFVYTDAGDKAEMTKTVDTLSGRTLWYADIGAEAQDVTFLRTSAFFDEETALGARWEKWFAGAPETSVYLAAGHQKGSWAPDGTAAIPSGSMEDFSCGLWMDTKGEGKTEDAVKWYQNGDEYHFYVPSYVDLSQVRLYSGFDSFIIDGTAYQNGAVVDLPVGGHQLKVVIGAETVDMGTLRVWQSAGTAAMLLSTKQELFTGLTYVNGEMGAWPKDSGITAQNYVSAYKDTVETKGSYRFYDADGARINEDDTLKKIKGRGNSSFEMSVLVYGK